MTTIANYKNKNRIEVSTKVLEKLAFADMSIPRQIKTVTYSFGSDGLDNLMIKQNMFCRLKFQTINNINTTNTVSITKPKQYIYLMKIKGLQCKAFKVGISSEPINRCKKLNKNWERYNVSFEIIRTTDPMYEAESVEKAFHKILEYKGLSLKDDIPKLDGYTEIFKTPAEPQWIIEMIF